MQAVEIFQDNAESWETLIFLYNSALKEVGTKLEILNESNPASNRRRASAKRSRETDWTRRWKIW